MNDKNTAIVGWGNIEALKEQLVSKKEYDLEIKSGEYLGVIAPECVEISIRPKDLDDAMIAIFDKTESACLEAEMELLKIQKKLEAVREWFEKVEPIIIAENLDEFKDLKAILDGENDG